MACHVDFNLDMENRVEKVHMTLAQTIDRAKKDSWHFYCRDPRESFKRLYARCRTCQKSVAKP